MTKIPYHFLALFADFCGGDELVLHKGPGLANWKIEILQAHPRWKLVPIPRLIWSPILAHLSDEWQGNIRFYHRAATGWGAIVKTCPPVDLERGMESLNNE